MAALLLKQISLFCKLEPKFQHVFRRLYKMLDTMLQHSGTVQCAWVLAYLYARLLLFKETIFFTFLSFIFLFLFLLIAWCWNINRNIANVKTSYRTFKTSALEFQKEKKPYSKESLKGIARRFYGLQEKGEGVMTMQFIIHKRENTMNGWYGIHTSNNANDKTCNRKKKK